jgi:hypothetical protein
MNKLQRQILQTKLKLEKLRAQVETSRKTKLEKVLFRQLGQTKFRNGDVIISGNGKTLFRYVTYDHSSVGIHGSFDERNEVDGWYTNYARPRELENVRWATKEEKNDKAFNYRVTIHEVGKPREVVCDVKTLKAAKAELMAARRAWTRRSKKNDKLRSDDYRQGVVSLTRQRWVRGAICITRIRAK